MPLAVDLLQVGTDAARHLRGRGGLTAVCAVLLMCLAQLLPVPAGAHYVQRTVSGTSTFGVASNFTPKTESVRDGFTTADTTVWTGFGAKAVIDSGGLAITGTTAYPMVRTTRTYDLTESYVRTRVVPFQSNNNDEAYLTVGDSPTIFKVDDVYPGTIDLQMAYSNGMLYFYKRAGQTLSSPAPAITYNATAHAYWQIRMSGTTAYWQTSPDGTTWTTRATSTVNRSVTSVYIRLLEGNYSSDSGGTAHFRSVGQP